MWPSTALAASVCPLCCLAVSPRTAPARLVPSRARRRTQLPALRGGPRQQQPEHRGHQRLRRAPAARRVSVGKRCAVQARAMRQHAQAAERQGAARRRREAGVAPAEVRLHARHLQRRRAVRPHTAAPRRQAVRRMRARQWRVLTRAAPRQDGRRLAHLRERQEDPHRQQPRPPVAALEGGGAFPRSERVVRANRGARARAQLQGMPSGILSC